MHADGDVGVNDARGRLQCRVFFKLGVDQRPIPEQQKFTVGMPAQRDGGPGNDDRCTEIATHGVKRVLRS